MICRLVIAGGAPPARWPPAAPPAAAGCCATAIDAVNSHNPNAIIVRVIMTSELSADRHGGTRRLRRSGMTVHLEMTLISSSLLPCRLVPGPVSDSYVRDAAG